MKDIFKVPLHLDCTATVEVEYEMVDRDGLLEAAINDVRLVYPSDIVEQAEYAIDPIEIEKQIV